MLTLCLNDSSHPCNNRHCLSRRVLEREEEVHTFLPDIVDIVVSCTIKLQWPASKSIEE